MYSPLRVMNVWLIRIYIYLHTTKYGHAGQYNHFHPPPQVRACIACQICRVCLCVRPRLVSLECLLLLRKEAFLVRFPCWFAVD